MDLSVLASRLHIVLRLLLSLSDGPQYIYMSILLLETCASCWMVDSQLWQRDSGLSCPTSEPLVGNSISKRSRAVRSCMKVVDLRATLAGEHSHRELLDLNEKLAAKFVLVSSLPAILSMVD